MENFMRINQIGQLHIDTILFESYYPILFTCLNEKGDLFLCVCCQANSEGKKWLITETNPEIMVQVLKNQITLRNAFLRFPKVQITVFADADGITVDESDKEAWDRENSIDLPDEGEFLDAEEDEFDAEILHFESLRSECCQEQELDKKGLTEMVSDLTDRIDIEFGEIIFSLARSVVYKLIAKEIQMLIPDESKNDSIIYDQMYDKVEKKILSENWIFDTCVSTGETIKEIPRAA